MVAIVAYDIESIKGGVNGKWEKETGCMKGQARAGEDM